MIRYFQLEPGTATPPPQRTPEEIAELRKWPKFSDEQWHEICRDVAQLQREGILESPPDAERE